MTLIEHLLYTTAVLHVLSGLLHSTAWQLSEAATIINLLS